MYWTYDIALTGLYSTLGYAHLQVRSKTYISYARFIMDERLSTMNLGTYCWGWHLVECARQRSTTCNTRNNTHQPFYPSTTVRVYNLLVLDMYSTNVFIKFTYRSVRKLKFYIIAKMRMPLVKVKGNSENSNAVLNTYSYLEYVTSFAYEYDNVYYHWTLNLPLQLWALLRIGSTEPRVCPAAADSVPNFLLKEHSFGNYCNCNIR